MIFCSQYSIECFMSLHFCIDLCTRNTTHGKHHFHGCLTQCLCMKCQQMAHTSTFWLFIHSLVLKRETTIELFWFIQLVAQLIGCIEHSGYNALHPLLIINPKLFPKWLFSTTRHHDTHHLKFKGNYGGYLAIWDCIMGTVIIDDDDDEKYKKNT